MKAFQFVEWKKPGQLREVPVPEPGPGQVLVKIGGAGACHSYWPKSEILEGRWTPPPVKAVN